MICKEVEILEKKEAEKRHKSSNAAKEKIPYLKQKGQSRDKSADKVGWSGKTFKNKEIRESRS